MSERVDSWCFGADKHEATHCEAFRFATFKTWPLDSHTSPVLLAKNGFFYAGIGDKVECFSCGAQYEGWTGLDKPRQVHALLSPTCQMVTGRQDPIGLHKNNVPIARAPKLHNLMADRFCEYLQKCGHDIVHGIQEQDLTSFTDRVIPLFHIYNIGVAPRPQGQAGNLGNFGIPTTADGRTVPYTARVVDSAKNPLYPDYQQEGRRLNTFWGFPRHLGDLVQRLCNSGFFYTHFNDTVVCCCCGVGVKGWLQTHDPQLVHARFSPACPLLPANLALFAQRDVDVVG